MKIFSFNFHVKDMGIAGVNIAIMMLKEENGRVHTQSHCICIII